MARVVSTEEPEKLIVIPESKWALFSAINNYPICVGRGHDWMRFYQPLVGSGVEEIIFCRRCGLWLGSTGQWDAAARDSDKRFHPAITAGLAHNA